MYMRGNGLRTIVTVALVCWFASYLTAGETVIKAEQLLPEDTVAAIVLPDLGAARASWAKTRFAQMLGQPEMQAFFKPPCTRLQEAYQNLREVSPLFPALNDLDAGLLSGELTLGLCPCNGAEIPIAGVLMVAPKDPAAFLRMLPPDFRQALQTGEVIPMGRQPSAPAMVWKKQRLVFCCPQGELAGVLARMENPDGPGALSASKTFAAARQPMVASAGWMYVNAPALKQFLVTLSEKEPDLKQALPIMGLLGLDDITSVAASVGFQDADMLLETFLGLVAEPKSPLFSLCDNTKPFPAELLKLAPVDAPYVWAGRFSSSKLIDSIRRIATQIDPKAAQQMDQGLAGLSKQVGFDLERDLLGQLGDEILVVETPVDTAPYLSFLPGMVVCVPVKEPARVELALGNAEKIVTSLLQAAMQGEERPAIAELVMPDLRRTEYRGRSILYIHGVLLTSPTALCVAGDRLLVGTSVNAVRRLLDQMEQPTHILENKAFQTSLARITGQPFDVQKLPAAFAYAEDRSTGTGSLIVSGLSLAGSAVGLGALQNALGAVAGPHAANENNAMMSCFSYQEAQEIYHQTDWDKDGVMEYAQSFRGPLSLYDKKDGEGDMLLIDEAMAQAEGEPGGDANKEGYRFKLLKEQGANAHGGAKPFVKDGNQVDGFAMVAYPVQYGQTGRRTFVIAAEGAIYAKDLGPQTAEEVAKMKAYNPDATWTEAEPKLDEPPAGGDEVEQFMASNGGRTAIRAIREIDLALWPDAGFFAKHRRATSGAVLRLPDGILWRTELPPPSPGSNPSSAAMMTSIPIMAGLMLPVLARARTQARRTASANNMKQLIVSCHLYSDEDKEGKFPISAMDLYPKYIRTAGVFQNPNNAGVDVSYYYIPGSTPADAENIVFFEAVPEGREVDGRNVAVGAGSIEWVTEDEFRERMEETAKALKEKGIEMKPIPLPVSKLQEKGPGEF